MKIFLRILALLVLSPLVFGDVSKTFTMTAPTQRENSDALALSELAQYRVICGLLPGGPYDVFQFDQAATGQATESISTAEVFPAGTYHCVATVFDTDALQSGNSNETVFTVGRCQVSDCRPRPPTLQIVF
jgi:hypothetical protein